MGTADEKVYSLAVVGTGIHGIHLASSIVEAGIVPQSEVILIDRHRDSLFLWDRRVRNCRMDYLRSPASHGLDPRFPALRREMRKNRDWTTPYHRPSVQLFRRHAEERVQRFLSRASRITGDVITIQRTRGTRGAVHEILIQQEGAHTDGTHTVPAHTVLLAPGMTPPHIPVPFKDMAAESTALPPVHHVHDPRFDPARVRPEERVLVVGGGIAALHLLPALADRGCPVTLWTRDPMDVHQFDSDPCFIGPRCSGMIAAVEDEEERLLLIRRNRRPGSVPPDLHARFQRDLEEGRYSAKQVEVAVAVAVAVADRKGAQIDLTGKNGTSARFDRVILCTGFEGGPPARSLVDRIARDLGAPLAAEGYPRVMPDLSWIPNLYVTGGLADLVIGPPARNIIGAHLARRRILPALRHVASQAMR